MWCAAVDGKVTPSISKAVRLFSPSRKASNGDRHMYQKAQKNPNGQATNNKTRNQTMLQKILLRSDILIVSLLPLVRDDWSGSCCRSVKMKGILLITALSTTLKVHEVYTNIIVTKPLRRVTCGEGPGREGRGESANDARC